MVRVDKVKEVKEVKEEHFITTFKRHQVQFKVQIWSAFSIILYRGKLLGRTKQYIKSNKSYNASNKLE